MFLIFMVFLIRRLFREMEMDFSPSAYMCSGDVSFVLGCFRFALILNRLWPIEIAIASGWFLR